MYKILVIDDEPRQLKALANIIQGLRPEFEIMTAGDGQEAYNLLQEKDFDILITDIKMPNMDGLELLEKIGSRRSRMKIIIISGFAEFAYAQKAISFGVNDYLVKPIRKADLEKMIENIEKAIYEDRIKKEKDESLQKKLDYSLPVYLEHQLNKWVKDNIDERGTDEIASIFPFKGMGTILLTVLKELDPSGEDLTENNTRQDIKFKMKETLNDLGHSISFFLEGNSRIMVTILNTNQHLNLLSQDNQRRLMDFINEIKEVYEVNVTIGIGDKTDNIFEDVSICFEQARRTLNRMFYQPLDKIIHFRGLESQIVMKTWNTDSLEKELTEAISRLDKNLCLQLASKALKDECPIMEPKNLKEIVTQLMLNVVKTLRNVMTDEEYHAFKENIKVKIVTCNEYKDLWRCVNGILYDAIDILNSQRKDINAVILQKCKKFIDENFCEEITLELVAQKYHFNNAYFSNLFKEQVGISFSKYLTKIRVENAQKLLITTDYSMREIALKVGISDPAYFNRIFKKEVGVAPNKYRQVNAHS